MSGRLRRVAPEIERALVAQSAAVADTSDADPEYRAGLRSAISASIEHFFAVIERRESEPPPVPAPLLTQARLAARHSIGLDVVTQRLLAGSAIVDEFILSLIPTEEWQSVLRARSDALTQLLAQVFDEYNAERARRSRGRDARQLERVRSLIRGESIDQTDLGYPLRCHHTAMVAKGDARPAIRDLAKQLNCTVLFVRPDEDTIWAWLGSTRNLDRPQLVAATQRCWNHSSPLAVGEPAHGLAGWRTSHRQALDAFYLAQRNGDTVLHYGDNCVIAAAAQNELLTSSLHDLFLKPLIDDPRSSKHLETLRAYFAASRSGASTAAALGVSRQTIGNRLRAVEDLLGRPLIPSLRALEVALDLADLGAGSPGTTLRGDP